MSDNKNKEVNTDSIPEEALEELSNNEGGPTGKE